MGSVALWHVESSRTGAWTRVPCTGCGFLSTEPPGKAFLNVWLEEPNLRIKKARAVARTERCHGGWCYKTRPRRRWGEKDPPMSLSRPISPAPQGRVSCNAAGEPGQRFQSFPLTPAQAIPMENHFTGFLCLFHSAGSWDFPAQWAVDLDEQQEENRREGWGRERLEDFRVATMGVTRSWDLEPRGQRC